MIRRNKKLVFTLAAVIIASNLGTATVLASSQNTNDVVTLEYNKLVNIPDIVQQTINFDKSNPKDVNITGIDYAGTELRSFSVGHDDENKNIDLSKVEYNEATKILKISAKAIKELDLETKLYSCKLVFSDETIIVGAININVIDSSIITPPVEPIPPSGDNTEVPPTAEKIEIDKNNLKAVEISNFLPKDSKVEYININGKELPVIYKDLRIAKASAPAVYVIGDKIVLSIEVLEYIGFDSSNYYIEAILEDGSKISKTVDLDIKDSSEIPGSKPEDGETPGEEKPEVPSEDKNADSSNNKNETTIVGTSAKTGDPIVTTVIGTIISGIGAVLLRRKK